MVEGHGVVFCAVVPMDDKLLVREVCLAAKLAKLHEIVGRSNGLVEPQAVEIVGSLVGHARGQLLGRGYGVELITHVAEAHGHAVLQNVSHGLGV